MIDYAAKSAEFFAGEGRCGAIPTSASNSLRFSILHCGGNDHFENRAHFFAAAAEAMRRILIDWARRKKAIKRGNGAVREELKEEHWIENVRSDELLAVDEGLDILAKEDPEAAQLIKLRYFVGMSMEEAATTMGMPLRSAERIWTYARAWLRRQIGEQHSARPKTQKS